MVSLGAEGDRLSLCPLPAFRALRAIGRGVGKGSRHADSLIAKGEYRSAGELAVSQCRAEGDDRVHAGDRWCAAWATFTVTVEVADLKSVVSLGVKVTFSTFARRLRATQLPLRRWCRRTCLGRRQCLTRHGRRGANELGSFASRRAEPDVDWLDAGQ